jgi:uncharacterized DUF497 family protein
MFVVGKTVYYGEDFEWDEDKAALNVVNHEGVTFEEASTAVVEPNALFLADDASDADEERTVVIGMSQAARVLLVVFVERGQRDRIISARKATETERRSYSKGEP